MELGIWDPPQHTNGLISCLKAGQDYGKCCLLALPALGILLTSVFPPLPATPYLVSPDTLLQDGLIHANDLVEVPKFPAGKVDFGKVIYWKLDLLNRSYLQFQNRSDKSLQKDFNTFCEKQANWLTDYATFMALKESQGGKPWSEWPATLRDRDFGALETFQKENEFAVQRQMYLQFLFFHQWNELHLYANQKGVRIIGDIPIFIAHDSADAWTQRELLYLDQTGQPSVVAGVPPDYFSPTGQLWGNPLYRWEIHARERIQMVDGPLPVCLFYGGHNPDGSFPGFCRILGDTSQRKNC